VRGIRSVAVVGLGLIGGSFEKAARAAGYRVTGLHHGDALAASDRRPSDFDLILVCLPPEAIVPWIARHASAFKDGALVVDICGTKRDICAALAELPQPNWRFIGGHPMAGREVSGYANSSADLFAGASMILTPPAGTPAEALDALRTFFRAVGFHETVEATPAQHDDMIAFTSQLCHVIATSYARDPHVRDAVGFSAGSYANMTRIATQDAAIWGELYRANRDALVPVLDGFLARVRELRDAIAAGDDGTVRALIREGTKAKRDELLARRRGDEVETNERTNP